MPSSWSFAQAVHGFQKANALVMHQLQLSRQLGNWFAERGVNWLSWLCFAILLVVVATHVARPSLLKKRTLHVSFVSLKTQVTQQVSEKSDAVDWVRLERILESCQVFDP